MRGTNECGIEEGVTAGLPNLTKFLPNADLISRSDDESIFESNVMDQESIDEYIIATYNDASLEESKMQH